MTRNLNKTFKSKERTRKTMKKLIIIALTLLALTVPASAQVIVSKIEMSPSILLPNDVADCKLTITAYTSTKINGIIFFTPSGIKIEPSSVSRIGLIPAGSSYELPFTLKAEKEGIHTVYIHIYTSNGTIIQVMNVRAEDMMPEIVIQPTTLTLNEVNNVSFYISTPLQISNVIVEPLFNADPRIIHVTNNKGSFSIYPVEPQKLSFKIKFYNGRNYHEVIQTIEPNYRGSKGVLVNLSLQYPTALLKDVIPINVELTNLRQDSIYTVKITAVSDFGNFSESRKEIPVIQSMESKSTVFLYSPSKAGINEITLRVTYLDKMNNEHTITKRIQINVLNEKPLSVSNIEVEKDLKGIRITGDISNNGRSLVYNVLLSMQLGDEVKTYYLGSIDPSDFDTFEFSFPVSNATQAVLNVYWSNKIGEKIEITQTIEVPVSTVQAEADAGWVVYVSAIAFVAVLAIVAIAWRKSRK